MPIFCDNLIYLPPSILQPITYFSDGNDGCMKAEFLFEPLHMQIHSAALPVIFPFPYLFIDSVPKEGNIAVAQE